MQNKFYITTTLPYVNAKPHMGHALEFVQADVWFQARELEQNRYIGICPLMRTVSRPMGV